MGQDTRAPEPGQETTTEQFHRIIRALDAALTIYDGIQGPLDEFSRLNEMCDENSEFLQEPLRQVEGVLVMIDELLHHFVLIDPGKTLSPLRLDKAREDARLSLRVATMPAPAVSA